MTAINKAIQAMIEWKPGDPGISVCERSGNYLFKGSTKNACLWFKDHKIIERVGHHPPREHIIPLGAVEFSYPAFHAIRKAQSMVSSRFKSRREPTIRTTYQPPPKRRPALGIKKSVVISDEAIKILQDRTDAKHDINWSRSINRLLIALEYALEDAREQLPEGVDWDMLQDAFNDQYPPGTDMLEVYEKPFYPEVMLAKHITPGQTVIITESLPAGPRKLITDLAKLQQFEKLAILDALVLQRTGSK